jgi:hypothetical protein
MPSFSFNARDGIGLSRGIYSENGSTEDEAREKLEKEHEEWTFLPFEESVSVTQTRKPGTARGTSKQKTQYRRPY